MLTPILIYINDISEELDPSIDEISNGHSLATRFYLKIYPPKDCPSDYVGVFNRVFHVPKYGYLSNIFRTSLPPSRTSRKGSDYKVEYYEWKKHFYKGRSTINERIVKIEYWNIPQYSHKKSCSRILPRYIYYPHHYLGLYGHLSYRIACNQCNLIKPEKEIINLQRKDTDQYDFFNYDIFPEDQSPYIFNGVNVKSLKGDYTYYQHKEVSPYIEYTKDEIFSSAGILWTGSPPDLLQNYQVEFNMPLDLEDIKRCSYTGY